MISFSMYHIWTRCQWTMWKAILMAATAHTVKVLGVSTSSSTTNHSVCLCHLLPVSIYTWSWTLVQWWSFELHSCQRRFHTALHLVGIAPSGSRWCSRSRLLISSTGYVSVMLQWTVKVHRYLIMCECQNNHSHRLNPYCRTDSKPLNQQHDSI